MIGRTVGKYRIVERLGRGGMGTVYKGLDETLDREVAIKVLNPDLADVELMKRFRAEAITLARLNHPGIATIYELYRQDDDLLMVMEFVRGETLHDLCERVGPMAPPQAAHLCNQVLEALAYAHRAGVVHRDLKPANLMVTEAGALKVMDFGIARVLGGEHLTHGGYMMGTPAYMSPEQVLGRDIDGRADLYAVGVLFYRLLTGELPFRADTAIAMAQKQIADPPTPVRQFRPDLPDWCAAVIERALAKEPDRRFQTADEFRAALTNAVRPEPLSEMPTQLTPAPPGIPRTQEMNELPATVVLGATPAPMDAVAQRSGAAAATALSSRAHAAPAPARRSPERTTTVVLGRTHLAALGVVLTALVAGVAVLAWLVLRQNATPAPLVDAAAEASVAPSSADAPTTSDGPPADSGSSAGNGPAPPAPESPAASPGGSRGEKSVATAGSLAATAAPPVKTPPAPRSTTSPATGSDTRAPRETPAAPGPATEPSRAAALPAMAFENVRYLAIENGRGREREGRLELTGDQLLVLNAARAPMTTLPYNAVTSAHYSRSRQPKWRDADGKEFEQPVDLGRLGFLRSDRNWLILITGAGPVVLRFEDAGLNTALSAVEQRLGVRIQR
jgi:serine/threonine-protein kinase